MANRSSLSTSSRGPQNAALLLYSSLALTCLFAAIVGCSGSKEKSKPEAVYTSTDSDTDSDLSEPYEPAPWYSWKGMFPGRQVVEAEPVVDPDKGTNAAELAKHGAYLTKSVAACGSCHAKDPTSPDSPLSGGRVIYDESGQVHASNITPDVETGIGSWTVAEIMQALRASIGKDNRALSLYVHDGYRWMSDRDARAIATYLLSQVPQRSDIPRRELGLFQRKRLGFMERRKQVRGYVPALSDTQAVPEYGRYLSQNVAGCKRCHTPRDGILYDGSEFAGSKPRRRKSLIDDVVALTGLGVESLKKAGRSNSEGVSDLLSEEAKRQLPQTAGNQTGTKEESPTTVEELAPAVQALPMPPGGPDIRGSVGLQGYTLEGIITYLSTGKNPDGKVSNADLCPWPYFNGMTSKDKQAIARYLKTL